MIFFRADLDRKQVQPRLLSLEQSDQQNQSRRYVREIINKFYIKEEYQKAIAEVYLISLFIPDISHPIILPNGPRASRQNAFLENIKINHRPQSFKRITG